MSCVDSAIIKALEEHISTDATPTVSSPLTIDEDNNISISIDDSSMEVIDGKRSSKEKPFDIESKCTTRVVGSSEDDVAGVWYGQVENLDDETGNDYRFRFESTLNSSDRWKQSFGYVLKLYYLGTEDPVYYVYLGNNRDNTYLFHDNTANLQLICDDYSNIYTLKNGRMLEPPDFINTGFFKLDDAGNWENTYNLIRNSLEFFSLRMDSIEYRLKALEDANA